MVRQAHTYLAGAVSGTVLVGAAVAAFVLLVSLQALRDWPLAELGFGDGGSSVEPAAHARGAAAGAAARRGVAGEAGARRATGSGGSAHRNASHGGATGLGRSPSPSPETPAAGGPDSAPAGAGPAGSGSASSGGSGSSGSGSGGGETSGSGRSVSGAVTGTVNETVSGADQATGGALGEAGVTKVTEETVNGLTGPESTVGETVDGVTETVGGVLGAGH